MINIIGMQYADIGGILGQSIDILTVILFIIILLIFFYGQNYQGWWAARQLRSALRQLDLWKQYGIQLIMKKILPFVPSTASEKDIYRFIYEILNFQVVAPSTLDPPVNGKFRYLFHRNQDRLKGLIKKFLLNIKDDDMSMILALFRTTQELDVIYRQVHHHLIIGKKTRSSFYLQKKASDITQTMLTALAYRTALDAFSGKAPVGDSVGPLAVKSFIDQLISKDRSNYKLLSIDNTNMRKTDEMEYRKMEKKEKNEEIVENEEKKKNEEKRGKKVVKGDYLYQKVIYREREIHCLRTIGPVSRVGHPADALEDFLNSKYINSELIKIIITIDATRRLAGEKIGEIVHGVGVTLGDNDSFHVEKYSFETLAYEHEPKIPVEHVVCKLNFVEALSPISEEILNSIPKIIQIVKQIIRDTTKPGDHVLLFGIGNGLGVEDN